MTNFNPDNERKPSCQEMANGDAINEQKPLNTNGHEEKRLNEPFTQAAQPVDLKAESEAIREENIEKADSSEAAGQMGAADGNGSSKFDEEPIMAEKEREAKKANLVQEVEVVEEYEEKHAGFWIRFWAFITDGLIVSALVSILVKPVFYLFGWDLSKSEWYAPMTIISGIFYYAYFIIMTKFWQQTVGKMIFGLKVKHLKEEKLSWGTVLFRELVCRFINNTIWLPYLMIAFTPKNQGLQDYIADTIVVHEKVYVKNEKKVIKEKIIEADASVHHTA